MRRDQLPLATLDGRHAGELLAHPCDCGRLMCTLGTHIWESTRDMKANGVKAQSYEPSGHTTLDAERTGPDPTDIAHLEYRAAIATYWRAARDLIDIIQRNRPDRWVELPEPASDNDWCRNHLTAGYCEPRYRGDLCRWCYDTKRAWGNEPDAQLMRERHEHGRQRDRDIAAWRARIPRTTKRKRRKAS